MHQHRQMARPRGMPFILPPTRRSAPAKSIFYMEVPRMDAPADTLHLATHYGCAEPST
jgi:hypothetical protein